ncbi:5-carboxymethyl-2-hydroxymuconate Delta-isomerase [Noviherbaspirillum cavernae]|uniref:5-carboxymethyl-2-hydroxymuconate Delta-isomerase n=1 Tax=Noviherbaspirillum cavernae TaxID=2320862 RepID=A0A418WV55_9BURK|nr:5-carboxymethyl-2-hydroxymuconate Delta-isomerase [Noviherbaspirillum cavernae]RJF96582.1 5-carboxymethyl-2-hydroxymuconate Delta-isomerase [Noviherbaspirillum cavernae]
MPHLTLEYSGNLKATGELSALCAKLASCLVAQQADGKPVYPIGGVRVRAIAVDEYCIADGAADAAFVHATLKIGSGRSEAVRQITGNALFDTMKTHFAALYDSMGLALSLEIAKFSEAGTWKHNNLHARYRRS